MGGWGGVVMDGLAACFWDDDDIYAAATYEVNWYRVDYYTALNDGSYFYVQADGIVEAISKATSQWGGDHIVRVIAVQVDGPPLEGEEE
jgi:hypothetical protein